MKRSVLALVLASAFFSTLLGCGRGERGADVLICIGTNQSELTQLDNLASFRMEILRHVRDNWDSRGQVDTDWIQVRSLFRGGKNDARETLGLEVEEAIGFSSERSTRAFRLRKESSGSIVVEERAEDGTIRRGSQTNAASWDVLEAMLASTLSDSILRSILSNGV